MLLAYLFNVKFLISSGNIKINSALQANSLLTNPLPSQVAMPLLSFLLKFQDSILS